MELLLPLINAVLYRVPRGGPGEQGWRAMFGFDGFGSTVGRLLYAFGVAIAVAVAAESYWCLLIGVYLWISAAWLHGTWAEYGPHVEKPNDARMFWAGVGLLSATYMLGYRWCYQNKDKLPKVKYILDGWTAWAEVFTGFGQGLTLFVVYHVIG